MCSSDCKVQQHDNDTLFYNWGWIFYLPKELLQQTMSHLLSFWVCFHRCEAARNPTSASIIRSPATWHGTKWQMKPSSTRHPWSWRTWGIALHVPSHFSKENNGEMLRYFVSLISANLIFERNITWSTAFSQISKVESTRPSRTRNLHSCRHFFPRKCSISRR